MEQAVVVVVRRGGRILMVQRGPRSSFSGWWQPVSGRIEAGETQAQAVVREAREEVGLHVQPLRKVWECPADGADFLLHWWLADSSQGEIAPDRDEISDARWLTPDEIRALPRTFPGDRVFFSRVLPALEGPAPGGSGRVGPQGNQT
jgi:8-oxo-dGTP pyrophosphatase MutT (NUDIX family)